MACVTSIGRRLLLALLLCGAGGVRAADNPDPDPAADARLAAEARSVVERYAQAYDRYIDALRRARTPADRERAEAETRPKPVPDAARLLAWAGRHPRDPSSAGLLSTVVRHGRFSVEAQRAAELLARDHLDLRGAAFAETAYCVILWPMPVAEGWMRAYLDLSPDPQTRARACLELALYEKWLVERASIEVDAWWVGQLEANFGKGSADYLKALDRDRLAADAVALLERSVGEFGAERVGEFGDPGGPGPRFADLARPHLDALTKLADGKPAPEVAGLDLDGAPLRLLDHRGKVVAITFWATWCPPCMEMIPAERALVDRFAGRPFALLGVNGDPDLDAARRAVVDRRINWRSWRDEGADGGSISRAWNVRNWPTTYLIDHRGVIRRKDLRGKDLEDAADRLVREAEVEAGAAPGGP